MAIQSRTFRLGYLTVAPNGQYCGVVDWLGNISVSCDPSKLTVNGQPATLAQVADFISRQVAVNCTVSQDPMYYGLSTSTDFTPFQ
jgi:hypothetical protein